MIKSQTPTENKKAVYNTAWGGAKVIVFEITQSNQEFPNCPKFKELKWHTYCGL